MVFDLANGLTGRGHKVVLFATDDSQTPDGGFLYKCGKAVGTVYADWLSAEREMWKIYDQCLDDFDIVNSHDWFGFSYASKARNQEIKMCHTHHGGLNLQWWKRSEAPFKLNIISISKWMKRVYESQGFNARHCYNPIDLSLYPFKKDKGDRLMFLGRIDAIKSPDIALDVALQSGLPIDVVGGTTFVTDRNYVNQIKGRCTGNSNFIGEVDHQTKLKHLQNAKALLIPSQFGEPFGLIAIEAMSCGTVPIALDDGALREIIEHEKSGFICRDVFEMVDAIQKIDTINPSDCRARAKEFSKEVCAEAYEKRYKEILDGDEW